MSKLIEFVIVYDSCLHGPDCLYSYEKLPDETAAKDWLEQCKQAKSEDYKTTCLRWTPEDWKKHFGYELKDDSDSMRLMTWDEWAAFEREKLLGNAELTLITKEEFWEKLEVLPPEHWVTDTRLKHFRMSEYLTGTYTNQYAEMSHVNNFGFTVDLYGTRLIDAVDKSTWITAEQMIEAYDALVESGEGYDPEPEDEEEQFDIPTCEKAVEAFDDYISEMGFEVADGSIAKSLGTLAELDYDMTNEEWNNWVDSMVSDGKMPPEASNWDWED